MPRRPAAFIGHLRRGTALLLAATGFGFPGPSSFWPRLLLAVVGTLNPSSGDVGVFLPLGTSRRVVVRLAALFSVDAFAGGLVVNALMALLLVRSALSQVDVPTRTAYVMAVVTPVERPAAASFTAVPRSLAAALSPTISGALFAAGFISWPLVACGVLKIACDLALWRGIRGEHLPGE